MPKIWIGAGKSGKSKNRIAASSFPNLKKLIKERAEKSGDTKWLAVLIETPLGMRRVVELMNNPFDFDLEEAHRVTVKPNGQCSAEKIDE